MKGKTLLLTLCASSLHLSHQASMADFEAMLERISKDTLEFADHMETLLLTENKCFQDNFAVCERGSYDDCNSEYPYATCSSADPAVLACGKGEEGGCSGFYDHTVSTLRLAPSIELDTFGEPEEDSVKDAICYSLQAETYMKNIEQRDMEYWSKYGVSPPAMFYGTDEGVFRMFPGQPKPQCPNTYDPRVRPWYVAGSSGPKSIVLVLDTSGSMRRSARLTIMKEATERVIQTLGVSDYVSVVEFNSSAGPIGNYQTLQRATVEKKKELLEYVKNFDAKGLTNFEDAFTKAFDVLENSQREEIGLSCHNAILFLTDGEISEGANANEVYNLISDKMADFTEERKPIMFTYSFGDDFTSTKRFGDVVPQTIACQNNGIWSSIGDGGDLADSMGAYYKYFAYGLGDSRNENFVAWVEPYEFADGTGIGTTASAPVYDRTVDPPVLAGVVGIDFSLQAFEKALGDESAAGRKKVIDKIVAMSVASCPTLELTECQRQSLRYYGGGEDSGNTDALCPSSTCSDTTDLKRISTATCNGVNYPTQFLDNRINEGRTHEERACCSVGEVREKGTLSYEEVKSSVCIEKGASTSVAAIIGIIVGVVLATVLIGVWWWKKGRKRKPSPSGDGNPYAGDDMATYGEKPLEKKPTYDSKFSPSSSSYSYKKSSQYKSTVSTMDADVVPVPPPTAPAFDDID